jgi:hypothetical protein
MGEAALREAAAAAKKTAARVPATRPRYIDPRTHANLARCELDTMAGDHLDPAMVHVDGNVRVVASRDLVAGELLYCGTPIIHMHAADPKTVLLFMDGLHDEIAHKIDRVTRQLYPVNDTQCATYVRRHVVPFFGVGGGGVGGVDNGKAAAKTEAPDDPIVAAWQQTKRVQVRLAARLLKNGMVSNMGAHESAAATAATATTATAAATATTETKGKEEEKSGGGGNSRDEWWHWARNWYVGASKLNHACYPNCMPTYGAANALEIRTSAAIKAGQECTIPYWFFRGELFLGASDERRLRYIEKVGGFRCMCLLCRRPKRAPGSTAPPSVGPLCRQRKTPYDYLVNLPDGNFVCAIHHLGKWCANCGTKCGDDQRCRACLAKTYCGAECQREHWRAAHRDECPRDNLKHAAMRPLVLRFAINRHYYATAPPPPPPTPSRAPLKLLTAPGAISVPILVAETKLSDGAVRAVDGSTLTPLSLWGLLVEPEPEPEPEPATSGESKLAAADAENLRYAEKDGDPEVETETEDPAVVADAKVPTEIEQVAVEVATVEVKVAAATDVELKLTTPTLVAESAATAVAVPLSTATAGASEKFSPPTLQFSPGVSATRPRVGPARHKPRALVFSTAADSGRAALESGLAIATPTAAAAPTDTAAEPQLSSE